MAQLEKLVKSLEALKVNHDQSTGEPNPVQVDETLASSFNPAKFLRKGVTLTKKEKINYCSTTVDCITSSQMVVVDEFPKYLSAVVEILLIHCNDQDSDVRSNANSCLNRLIKISSDSVLSKIQVELSKEIKKINTVDGCNALKVKSYCTALGKFGSTCSKIRMSKRYAFWSHIYPCLVNIIKIKSNDESIMETFGSAFERIITVFGSFATDIEIQTLAKLFIQVITSSSTSSIVRRTCCFSLSSVVSLCKHSTYTATFVLQSLLTKINTAGETHNLSTSVLEHVSERKFTLIGSYNCLKYLSPVLQTIIPQIVNGSLVETPSKALSSHQKDVLIKEVTTLNEQILQMYEYVLCSIQSEEDLLITMAAIETLLSLLKYPSRNFLAAILDEDGIGKSRIGDHQMVRSASVMSSPSNKFTFMNLEIPASLGDDETRLVDSSSFKLTTVSPQESELEESCFTSSVESNELKCQLEQSESAPESEIENVPQHNASKDVSLMRLTFDMEDEDQDLRVLSPSPSCLNAPENIDSPKGNIGLISGKRTSLEFITRLICSKYLLGGSRGKLLSDQNVRVSVKSVALNCMCHVVKMYPASLLLDIFLPSVEDDDLSDHNEELNKDDAQKIWDILLYSSHPDPQVRSLVAVLISNFVSHVLTISSAGYNCFLMSKCPSTSFASAPSLEDLINRLYFDIIQDSRISPTVIRAGINSFTECLQPILQSNEAISPTVVHMTKEILQKFLTHNYWLVKVEILNLVARIPFKEVCFLETTTNSRSNGVIYSEQSSIQEMVILNVLPSLMSDGDHRVRSLVPKTMVKVVEKMYSPEVISSATKFVIDPVVAIAYESSKNTWCEKQDFEEYLFPRNVILNLESADLPFEWPFCSRKIELAANELSLRTTVNFLKNKALQSFDERKLLFCCISTLRYLSQVHPPTQNASSWNCSDLSFTRYLITLLVSAGSSSSTSPTSCNFILTEVDIHSSALLLIGNFLAGHAYSSIKTAVNDGFKFDDSQASDWGPLDSISGDLVILFDLFAGHLLKMLHLVTSVLNGSPILTAVPQSSSSATFTSTSISPLRRSQSLRTNNLEVDPKRSNITPGSVYHRFYYILKSTYSNYLTLNDHNSRNKLTLICSSILTSLSQVLEVSSFNFLKSNLEPVLEELRTTTLICPVETVVCTKQLLKCIFACNFSHVMVPRFEENVVNPETTVKSPVKGERSEVVHSAGQKLGLYQLCISQPLTHFTRKFAQKLVSSHPLTFSSQDVHKCYSRKQESIYFMTSIKKNSEKQISLVLEKPSPIPLSSFIKPFEPLVIKLLKNYTITSNIELQQEVLTLLSLLIRLRVNYSLLDSDQVFLNFVLKQLDFFESGHIKQPQLLIDAIFNFLLVLSYEKFDSNVSITTISKVIQLADVLSASGQSLDDHLLPALKCIVEDVFLYRSPTKVDSIKELDTQKEVIIAMLLKIIHHANNSTVWLDLLITIVTSTKKESDEKWKKVSRLIMDSFLIQLSKQSLNITTVQSLNLLFELFEVVSPVVYRPVDLLLKMLFSPPEDDILSNQNSFCKWSSLFLATFRIMIIQVREETILTRLNDMKHLLRIGNHGLQIIDSQSSLRTAEGQSNPFNPTDHDSSLNNEIETQETVAEFLLQVVELLVYQLAKYLPSLALLPETDPSNKCCQFLSYVISQYFVLLTHVFQCGNFRKITKSVAAFVSSKSGSARDNQDGTQCTFDTSGVNLFFEELEILYPSLVLQWNNILLLLSYDDGENNYWLKIIQKCIPENSESEKIPESLKIRSALSPHLEMLRRGVIVLLCDFSCESTSDADRMTWLIVENTQEIIMWQHELPVQDFISAIHRNSASSSLFIQAINLKCLPFLDDPTFVIKMLSVLEFIHPKQSGSVIALLIERILVNESFKKFSSVIDRATDLAVSRLKMIAESNEVDEMTKQLKIDDVNNFLSLISKNEHPTLNSQLLSFLEEIGGKIHVDVPGFLNLEVSKEWFKKITETFCQHHDHVHPTLSPLCKLQPNDFTDLIDVNPSLVGVLLEAGVLESRIDEGRKPSLSTNLNDDSCSRNILLKCGLAAIGGELYNLCQMLPNDPSNEPYMPFLPENELLNDDEIKNRRKLVELFEEGTVIDILMSIQQNFNNFLSSFSSSRPSAESLKVIERISILFCEVASWASENPSNFHLIEIVLPSIEAFVSTDAVFNRIENSDTSIFTLVHSLNCMARFFCCQTPNETLLPKMMLDKQAVDPACKRAHNCCSKLTSLVNLLESRNSASRIDCLKKIIIQTSRVALVNSFILVPPQVWQTHNQWSPNAIGEHGTMIPTVPSEELNDEIILKSFISRICLIGWISRIQFEEIWMSLLGVVSCHTQGNTNQGSSIVKKSPERENSDSDINDEVDVSEKVIITNLAIEGLTNLLLQSMLIPKPGNPVKSSLVPVQARRVPFFTHTKFGQKYSQIETTLRHIEDQFIGDSLSDSKYQLGHISLEYLRKTIERTSKSRSSMSSPDLSASSIITSSTSSGSAPIPGPALTTVTQFSNRPVVNPENVDHFLPHRESIDLDLHSCLYFLLDLYNSLLTSSSKPLPPPLLRQLSKSLCFLSDLFFEKSQYEWMLKIFLDLYIQAVNSEDELQIQFLTFGIIKSSAVLGVDADPLDKLKKCIENGLKSAFLATRISTLQGLLFLFEFKGVLNSAAESQIVPVVCEYIERHLSDSSLPSSHCMEHLTLLWKLSFLLIEHLVDDFNESEFGNKIFKLSMTIINSDEEDVPNSHELRALVSDGLIRLLICETFAIKHASQIVSICLDQLKSGSNDLEVNHVDTFKLLITCIYVFGISIGDDMSDTNEDLKVLLASDLEENGDVSEMSGSMKPSASREDLVTAMEKITIMFERLRTTKSFYEASIISSVVPIVLIDFFPPQDTLNKVIGEFISVHHHESNHPSAFAQIVFDTFDYFHSTSQSDIIQEWMMLSFSSFLQLEPACSAVWFLNVFLISASTDFWLKSIFPCIKRRFGVMTEMDTQILSVVCNSFHDELTKQEDKAGFISSIESAAKSGTPYLEALHLIQSKMRACHKTSISDS